MSKQSTVYVIGHRDRSYVEVFSREFGTVAASHRPLSEVGKPMNVDVMITWLGCLWNEKKLPPRRYAILEVIPGGEGVMGQTDERPTQPVPGREG